METSYTKTEVTDVMALIYFRAQEQLARLKPPEVRVLSHLLKLDDPLEIDIEMEKALISEPGVDGDSYNYLSTTPERLTKTVDAVLKSFKKSRTKRGHDRNSTLMEPVAIRRLG